MVNRRHRFSRNQPNFQPPTSPTTGTTTAHTPISALGTTQHNQHPLNPHRPLLCAAASDSFLSGPSSLRLDSIQPVGTIIMDGRRRGRKLKIPLNIPNRQPSPPSAGIRDNSESFPFCFFLPRLNLISPTRHTAVDHAHREHEFGSAPPTSESQLHNTNALSSARSPFPSRDELRPFQQPPPHPAFDIGSVTTSFAEDLRSRQNLNYPAISTPMAAPHPAMGSPSGVANTPNATASNIATPFGFKPTQNPSEEVPNNFNADIAGGSTSAAMANERSEPSIGPSEVSSGSSAPIGIGGTSAMAADGSSAMDIDGPAALPDPTAANLVGSATNSPAIPAGSASSFAPGARSGPRPLPPVNDASIAYALNVPPPPGHYRSLGTVELVDPHGRAFDGTGNIIGDSYMVIPPPLIAGDGQMSRLGWATEAIRKAARGGDPTAVTLMHQMIIGRRYVDARATKGAPNATVAGSAGNNGQGTPSPSSVAKSPSATGPGVPRGNTNAAGQGPQPSVQNRAIEAGQAALNVGQGNRPHAPNPSFPASVLNNPVDPSERVGYNPYVGPPNAQPVGVHVSALMNPRPADFQNEWVAQYQQPTAQDQVRAANEAARRQALANAVVDPQQWQQYSEPEQAELQRQRVEYLSSTPPMRFGGMEHPEHFANGARPGETFQEAYERNLAGLMADMAEMSRNGR